MKESRNAPLEAHEMHAHYECLAGPIVDTLMQAIDAIKVLRWR